MSEQFDTVVIGAGVVGLAVARALSAEGREVLILERHLRPAQETSARNSGVVHSGIYYPTGSLKASLCVRGRELLYTYCQERGIAHKKCGKLIVARESQRAALLALHARAARNGVHDLRMLDAREARNLEPQVKCDMALYSPETGIVDVHDLVLAYIADIERNGGTIAYGSEAAAINLEQSGIEVSVRSGGDVTVIRCASLVNAAGLSAPGLLANMRGYKSERLREAYYAKGSYFSLRVPGPFTHLVYPMPGEAGLGIHATLDLGGGTRFGPNVTWIPSPEYSVDERDAAEFYDSIRSYWPALPDGALQADYAGVRPKLVGPGAAAADFMIEGLADHGHPGLVNLLGIESPGLTSSLAIGEHVKLLL